MHEGYQAFIFTPDGLWIKNPRVYAKRSAAVDYAGCMARMGYHVGIYYKDKCIYAVGGPI